MNCSIVTSRYVTGSSSSSNHAGEDQAYSHRYSASMIQPSSPFISLIKGRKTLSCGSEGNLALCLHLSPAQILAGHRCCEVLDKKEEGKQVGFTCGMKLI